MALLQVLKDDLGFRKTAFLRLDERYLAERRGLPKGVALQGYTNLSVNGISFSSMISLILL